MWAWALLCFLVRAGIAALAWYLRNSPDLLRLLGGMCLFPAVGFSVIYVFRLRDRGLETGGRRIWWDSLRPVHAALWLWAALLGVRGEPCHLPLALDASLGGLVFLRRHLAVVADSAIQCE
jgi:hypothetical protein